MKNNITELVFIIDRSGSMSGLESDTIGGFNSMLKKQKAQDGMVYVSTVFFSNNSEVIHDRKPIDEVTPLTEKDYTVGGCTALLDAIGGAIKHISTIHKYARPEDIPQHTIFVITTDGMENASHKYSSKEVKKLIKHKTKEGWEFLFASANIDAVETASNIGILGNRAINYKQTSKGTGVMYEAFSKAVSSIRKDSFAAESWQEESDCK